MPDIAADTGTDPKPASGPTDAHDSPAEHHTAPEPVSPAPAPDAGRAQAAPPPPEVVYLGIDYSKAVDFRAFVALWALEHRPILAMDKAEAQALPDKVKKCLVPLNPAQIQAAMSQRTAQQTAAQAKGKQSGLILPK